MDLGETGDPQELALAGPEPRQRGVLAAQRRAEEAGVVRRERDGHARAEQLERRVARRAGQRAGRGVRHEADVQGDAPARQEAHERRVLRGADAVRDAHGPEMPESLGHGFGSGPLARVHERREAEGADAAVDARELAGRHGALVPAEAEADDARPGVPLVDVEDALRRLRTPVAHGVEQDAQRAAGPPLVRREDRLQRGRDLGPRQADALYDRRRDVDLGVADPLPLEAPHEVAGHERVVGGAPELEADVAVQRQEVAEVREAPTRADAGHRREERVGVPPRQGHERGGGDRPLQVEVELGLREAGEIPQERVGGSAHGSASYANGRGGREGGPPSSAALPRERLWIRGAALGVDLLVLTGGPLLLTTLVVFSVLVATPDPPASLPGFFRAAQVLAVVLLLGRDTNDLSPGKRLFGLHVVGREGRPATFLQSVARNLPLLVPVWNLVEVAEVLRRSDGARTGDRLAGTRVVEVH